MAQIEQARAFEDTPKCGQAGNDLVGLGDWHFETLRLYDGYQQKKKQVSRSIASRHNQLSPSPSRQDHTQQKEMAARFPDPLYVSQRHDFAVDAVPRSHARSTQSNRSGVVGTSPDLSCLLRRRTPPAMSKLTKITRDLYFQGKPT
ncbi:hypothetical protein VM1G_04273 [Cytospora mali]|uniref:Uncharacterized protein n=1 Tax=Cytospora mali TaxID=578113 RepID=A0A194VY77_CYTMA|nr:hypothetical protein VM1G_04273 [Valsa mali]